MNEAHISVYDKNGHEYKLGRLTLEELVTFERKFNCSLAQSARTLSWMMATSIIAAALGIPHERVLADFDCATLAAAVNTILNAYMLSKDE